MRLPLSALVLAALGACASAPKPTPPPPAAPLQAERDEGTSKLVVDHVRVDDDDGSFESAVESDAFVRFLGQLVLALGSAMRGQPVEHGSLFTLHATLYADRAHDVTLESNHAIPEPLRTGFLARARALETVHAPKSPVRIELAVRLPGDAPPALPASAPWGNVVDDPALQERARAAFSAIDAGGDARSHFAEVVLVGPKLWARLSQGDAALAQLGIPSKSVQPTRAGVTESDEMRSFSRAGEVERLLASAGMRALAKRYSRAAARAATLDERQAFYATIPFEISGKPVPVLTSGDEALVAAMTEGQVFWIDLLPAAK